MADGSESQSMMSKNIFNSEGNFSAREGGHSEREMLTDEAGAE